MTEKTRDEKGFEFEKEVANYYRDQGNDDVRIREHHTGESTVSHELDVVVYDQGSPRPRIACQCKYKATGAVTKNDIAKWRDKCQDVGVEEIHYAATRFNANTEKYAAGRGVTLITPEDLEGIPVETPTVTEWESQLSNADSQTDRLLFCLRTISETNILAEAADAANEPADELRFHKPRLYELFKNPETQYGTKLLKAINRVDGEDVARHAFGSQRQSMGLQMGGEAFQIPPEVGDRDRAVQTILDRASPSTVPALALDNPGEQFEVFLKAWEHVSESPLNPRDLDFPGYANFRGYGDRDGFDQLNDFVLQIEPKEVTERLLEDHVEPQVKFWSQYLNRVDDVERARQLFEADISRFEPRRYHPFFGMGASDTTPLLDIFQTADIVCEARAANKNRVETFLSKLRNTEIGEK